MGTLHLAVNLLAFLKDRAFQKSKVGTLHQKRNIFSQEHHAFFEQLASSMMMLIRFGQNTVAIARATFMLIEDVKVSLVEEA